MPTHAANRNCSSSRKYCSTYTALCPNGIKTHYYTPTDDSDTSEEFCVNCLYPALAAINLNAQLTGHQPTYNVPGGILLPKATDNFAKLFSETPKTVSFSQQDQIREVDDDENAVEEGADDSGEGDGEEADELPRKRRRVPAVRGISARERQLYDRKEEVGAKKEE